jgi:hypothetical protein
LVELFYFFIREVAMVLPVMSKSSYRYGKSPIEIWEAERPEAIHRKLTWSVSDKALAMFCCRTSKTKTIGKNGVKDSDLRTYYYETWMDGMVGRKIYLRRAPGVVEEAWVFDAENDSIIDKARWLEPTPALANTEAEAAQLEKALARVKTSKKVAKIFANPGPEISVEEKVDCMAAYAKSLRPEPEQTTETSNLMPPLLLTDMDRELHKYNKRAEEQRKEGLQDLSFTDHLAPPPRWRTYFQGDFDIEEEAQLGNPHAIALLDHVRSSAAAG